MSYTEAFERYLHEIPDHECSPDCPYPSGFALVVTKQDDHGVAQVITHKMSAGEVAYSFIVAWEEQVQETRPDDMPPAIAFAHGREALRAMIDDVPPPGDISANLSDVIQDFLRGRGE